MVVETCQRVIAGTFTPLRGGVLIFQTFWQFDGNIFETGKSLTISWAYVGVLCLPVRQMIQGIIIVGNDRMGETSVDFTVTYQPICQC